MVHVELQYIILQSCKLCKFSLNKPDPKTCSSCVENAYFFSDELISSVSIYLSVSVCLGVGVGVCVCLCV